MEGDHLYALRKSFYFFVTLPTVLMKCVCEMFIYLPDALNDKKETTTFIS